ncbi:MAG: MG2 domain-containing protein [Roseibacillus sp.]
MKTLLRLSVLLAIAPLSAQPALHIDTSSFSPNTTFKLTFDKPVVENSEVGQSFANTLLDINPPVAGYLKWTETNVAEFVRSAVPSIDTKFTFSIAKGHSYLDGKSIPTGTLRTLRTSPFLFEYGYWRGTPRTPRYFVRFNDEVDPAAAASNLSFVDKEGNRVAANVRRGVYGDLGIRRALGPTWKQRFGTWTAPDTNGLDPNTAIPSALTVTPVHPLPVGESWKLVIAKGLANASGSAAITRATERWIGSVRSFEIASIQAVTRIDSPRYISIGLSKALSEDVKIEDLKGFITIEPVPENMEIEAKRSLISIKGDFAGRSEWKVTVKRGFAAADGLAMIESKSEKVKFKHIAPILATPSYAAAQLAIGSRTYKVETTNIASARIRVKRLTGKDAIRTFQGYRHYSGDGPGGDRFKDRHTIPWSLVAGEPIYDRAVQLDNEHDTSRPLEIKWDEVLGEGKANSLLFVSIEGVPKKGMESAYDKNKTTQVFLQLTDIGLAWKLNDDTAFIYAYSCDTGQPLADVQLDVFGEDAAALQTTQTNESGVARLPRASDQRHLRASLGGDSLIVTFDQSMPTVSMWRFPVRTEWNRELANKRTVLLFTDRTLYRPGEQVHLKGIVRRIENNRSVFDTTQGAELVIRDSSSRVLVEREVTLSRQGSFDYSFQLPAETVGFFSLQVRWPDEIAAATAMDDWRKRSAHLRSARFTHNINVQEFRRNAFEVESTFAEGDKKDTLKLDLTARYYQGQPVADANVKWFYRSREAGFYPADFRDFLFCDHRTYDPYYWSYYFGYGESTRRRTYQSKNGTAALDQDGFASIEFALEEIEFPSPRTVTVTSEIRDQRNQTLSADAATTIHSSNVYLGVSRVDRLVRVGADFQVKAIAITSNGEPATEPLTVSLKIEREINEQIKTKTASGTIAVRNERRLEIVEERSLTIEAAHNRNGGLAVPFEPEHSGKHILTFSGTDSAGKEFRTSVIHRVYGSKEYPWAYENGMLIKLVPEKKRYKPGETARILVQSPIEGTALVTLEREGVHRYMIRELTAENPVIEIPVTDEDAPNTFVSVLLIKGSQDNLRKHKEPILRLGYCELSVENVKERLQIAMKIPGDYHRPGEEITIDGLVRDARGNPVKGAEVTLYAEDEGTLAVAGYANPNPLAHFYAPRSLRTKAGTSLGKVLSEDPDQLYTFNKGFFIGGGGGELDGNDPPRLRKDFDPCAIWAPALATDADGRFQVVFDSPDTLTRYRVIAVAQQGPAHFGSETSQFVVNKPLMLEPSTPRFAHEGDRLQPKVLVQNATSFTGTWQISLKLGSITNFVEGSEKTQSKTITIPADGDATVSFDLTFANTGEVDWQWSAKPLSIDGAALNGALAKRLSDAVATNFAVEYPMPLLRETHFIRFENPSAQRDMLEGLSKELLEGRGELELEFGRSVLLEADGALDFLLKYPYGCVEQTTSSTIPWIAALNLRDVAPAFRGKSEKEIRTNIQVGANRLLSMQCDDGGLAYWPGGNESTDWASAYGGMALLLCREAGASVPESSVTGLRKYLAAQLRGIAKTEDWWDLETACRGCYTLALAGDPQVAYHNKLLENTDRLSPNALNFLALAVFKSGADNAEEAAKQILAKKGTVPQRGGHFLHHHPSAAYRLLALSTVTPKSAECDKTIDRILRQRGRAGHWHTTWANAWTIFALGEYARKVETQSAPPVISFATDGGNREIKLDDKNPSAQVSIPLHGGLKALAAAPQGAFARVHLASKPKIAPQRSVSKNGLQILRTYHRVNDDGSTELLEQPEVGDLVKIELQITMPRDGTRYLVIDDPLPSIFEAVNTEFGSQAGRLKKTTSWRISNQELRDDRAVFFVNYIPRSGSYKVSYHARVTSAGTAVAPPAKVEAMYEPEFYALSSSRAFKTPNPLHTAAR